MEKGARVTIIDGRQGKGVSGAIFWKGPNKWGEGERLGIRGDDGETYWVADSDVEPASGAPPKVEAGPTFNKGDRVQYRQRGEEGTGTVFWIGESRSGPGQRLGVRDDITEDAVWLDARQAKALEEGADGPPSAGSGPRGPAPRGPAEPMPVHLANDDDESEVPWMPSLSEDELPPAAPWDDEGIQATVVDDDDVPPWEP